MAVQFLPIIKAVAPYVAQIATVAIPAFTRKPDQSTAAVTDPVVVKQIEELQLAATRNAESIHTLADSVQKTMSGLEIAAEQAKAQVALYQRLLYLSVGVSLVSIAMSLWVLLR